MERANSSQPSGDHEGKAHLSALSLAPRAISEPPFIDGPTLPTITPFLNTPPRHWGPVLALPRIDWSQADSEPRPNACRYCRKVDRNHDPSKCPEAKKCLYCHRRGHLMGSCPTPHRQCGQHAVLRCPVPRTHPAYGQRCPFTLSPKHPATYRERNNYRGQDCSGSSQDTTWQ